ncbi:MAG: SO_0444 family Cu/Zn efflux transporter [Magnetococcales bacterium]|nr:SO_0444 family Cu/Zn efflux transporter [Magnetococcales bacterium]
MSYLNNLLDLTLDMAPWLVGGLLAAGFIKYWIPESTISRWLGGKGSGPILRGALIGAPLPLCSCSVIPMALGLRRNGASKPATVSFLVATPETGVDSVAVSWIMLGPIMTIIRPITAILSALLSGFLTLLVDKEEAPQQLPKPAAPKPIPVAVQSTVAAPSGYATRSTAIPIMALGSGNTIPIMTRDEGGCATMPILESQNSSQAPGPAMETNPAPTEKKSESACSSGGCCGSSAPEMDFKKLSVWRRFELGVRYALTDLWDDLALWLGVGLLLAAAVMTWLPPGDLHQYADGGIMAMLLIVVASIPVYVCATASTPLAAAMLYSGLTPGMALAFLIAGPATNIAPLGIIGRELGWKIMAAYVLGILLSAVGFGLLIDWIALHWNLVIEAPMASAQEDAVPLWLSGSSTVLLVGLTLRTFLKKQGFFNQPGAVVMESS